mmetsp:Transcript_27550/g.69747  ORF Transcript_27550/g.69747 Transcript_27550/m.69747 type:complete len:238 (+) Transcript_27550:173-886(+)
MCAIAAIGPSPGWLARACGVRGARAGGGGSSVVPTSAAGGAGSGARLGARPGASVTRRRGTASTRSSIWGKGSGWRSWSSACAHCSMRSIMGSMGACACFCARRRAALRRPAVFWRAACVSSSAVGAALLSSYASRSIARSSSARKAGWPSARGESSACAKASASSTPPLRMSSTSCCCFSLKLSSGSPARIAGSTALVRSIACWISPHCTALRMTMRSDTVSRSMPASVPDSAMKC